MNQTSLLGFLRFDPEIRMSKSQTPYCRFIISVPKVGKKKKYNFISCITYGKSAEALVSYFKKGNKILVTGYIETGNFNNKNTFSVIVHTFYGMNYNHTPQDDDEDNEDDLDFLDEEG